MRRTRLWDFFSASVPFIREKTILKSGWVSYWSISFILVPNKALTQNRQDVTPAIFNGFRPFAPLLQKKERKKETNKQRKKETNRTITTLQNNGGFFSEVEWRKLKTGRSNRSEVEMETKDQATIGLLYTLQLCQLHCVKLFHWSRSIYIQLTVWHQHRTNEHRTSDLYWGRAPFNDFVGVSPVSHSILHIWMILLVSGFPVFYSILHLLMILLVSLLFPILSYTF